MLNIVVTGCAGYIGSKLTHQLLCNGHSVIGIDNLKYQQNFVVDKLRWMECKPKTFDRNFHFINDDLMYDDWLEYTNGADVIIHLAALVGAPICNLHKREYVHDINVRSVQQLIKHISKNQLVLFPNTNSGYGVADKNSVCTEESPMNPISEYGITKCLAENIVLQHENSVAFRLATVFGVSPRMRFDLMVNDFVLKAYIDKKIEVFEPNFRRNFIHIQDVCDAFVFAIDNHVKMRQNVYNLGQDRANTTKGELAKIVCEIVGGEVTYKDGKDPDQRDYNVSSKKIMNAGFIPSITLHSGISEVNSYCQMLGLEFMKTDIFKRSTRNA